MKSSQTREKNSSGCEQIPDVARAVRTGFHAVNGNVFV